MTRSACATTALAASMMCLLMSTATAVTPLTTGASAAQVLDATNTLQSAFYDPQTGSYGCDPALQQLVVRRPMNTQVGWWNCANSLEAVANTIIYLGASPSTTNLTASIKNTWSKTAPVYKVRVVTDTSNDDQGWWALAWLRAGQATGHSEYLARTAGYFNHVGTFWDATCGGGVWWSGAKQYKNAITNELYLMTAAKMYLATGNLTYLTVARRTWAWFNASGMINPQYLINDGLTNPGCKNNGATAWTYNQGVILGGLVHLWQAEAKAAGSSPDPNSEFLHLVARLANASTSLLVSNGVLVESCEAANSCNNDQSQFKGILVRYIAYAIHEIDGTLNPLPSWWLPYRAQLMQFLQVNVASLWANDLATGSTKTRPLFGLRWTGPADVLVGTQTQTSGLDLLSALLRSQSEL